MNPAPGPNLSPKLVRSNAYVEKLDALLIVRRFSFSQMPGPPVVPIAVILGLIGITNSIDDKRMFNPKSKSITGSIRK